MLLLVCQLVKGNFFPAYSIMRLEESGILFSVIYHFNLESKEQEGMKHAIEQSKISAISLTKLKVGSLELKLKFDRGFIRWESYFIFVTVDVFDIAIDTL